MDTFSYLIDVLSVTWRVFAATWWIYTPLIIIFVTIDTYKRYTKKKFLMGLKWVLLEITPPPDVQKSPKIMENFYSGIHSIFSPVDWRKKFFGGKETEWFSLEIAGSAGEMRFYIQCLEGHRNLVESHIFGQYPDAEIKLAEDYTAALPEHLPNDEYDLFGTELIFAKDNAYPIKTHPEFEEQSGKDEFKRTDPLAPLAEVFTSLVPGESLWLQLLMRPVGDDWVKASQATVDKIVGKEAKPPERDPLAKAFDFVDALLPGASSGAPAEKKDKQDFSLQKLTPGQKLVLEKIEDKMAKLGFEGGYRFVYVARKDAFNRARISSVIGMFKQVYSNNLNTFKPNMKTMTVAKGKLPWLFPSEKGFFAAEEEYEKKVKLYGSYRKRAFVKQPIILNTEELATLFHLPGANIKAPAFIHVEAKKAQPPIGLPMK